MIALVSRTSTLDMPAFSDDQRGVDDISFFSEPLGQLASGHLDLVHAK
jgi:hypothetical protein